MKKFKIIKNIGHGTFGTVYKARDLNTGDIVAIKKLKRRYLSSGEWKNIREVQFLKNIKRHENVIGIRTIFREFNSVHFVFEFMDNDLCEVMKEMRINGKRFTEDVIRNLVAQIFKGLGYIHRKGYFHRDMKPENMLIKSIGTDGYYALKLADFGLAREIRSLVPLTEYVSTRWYRAPEVLLKAKKYGFSIDLFACGAIMSELYTLSPLFPGDNERDELFKLCCTLGTPTKRVWREGFRLARIIGYTFPYAKKTPLKQLIPNASDDAVDLMEKLMRWDPKMRPNCKEALNHPFFTKHEHKVEQNCIYTVMNSYLVHKEQKFLDEKEKLKGNETNKRVKQCTPAISKRKMTIYEPSSYGYSNEFWKKDNAFMIGGENERSLLTSNRMIPSRKNESNLKQLIIKPYGNNNDIQEIGISKFKRKISRETTRKRNNRMNLFNYNSHSTRKKREYNNFEIKNCLKNPNIREIKKENGNISNVHHGIFSGISYF